MLQERLSSFCHWTTLHGFPFFTSPRKHKNHNCFWAIVIALSVAGAVFVVYTNIDDFCQSTVSYDLVTPTHSLDDVFFPSIVLCNMNKLRASFIRAIMQELGRPDTYYHDIYDLLQRVFVEVSKLDSCAIMIKLMPASNATRKLNLGPRYYTLQRGLSNYWRNCQQHFLSKFSSWVLWWAGFIVWQHSIKYQDVFF